MSLDAAATSRLAGLLKQHPERLVETWTTAVAESLRGRLTRGELERQVHELYQALTSAAESGDLDLGARAEGGGELRAVLADLSRSRARQGFTATETAVSVFALKDALHEVMALDDGEDRAFRDFISYSRVIDQLGLYTFESYSAAREEVIADQAEQLLELSTPVVKLWEGVVAVPLVGTLDSARAQVVMERLLQILVDTGSPYAIIDITGVPAVDTQVAQHILKTVVAARLMGAECVISGIRPQIAQTIVALGIEFGDIATKATLADALRHALRRIDAEGARPASRREA